ncbi:MAG: DNA topoisomerase IV subunit A [Magnetococcales bacterium]|nr:DNA topoisomerase IV subunit A [Magnetococcales bacterium]
MGETLSMLDEVDESPVRLELEERYLAYALSTIINRSLPDVRDGLKPVHRRILFAMRALRLAPRSSYKKSARVVGDVIGKFHPHGDQAAYDAMVRLAQDFAVRYPLVDGQGNFGNIDGDGAAAMRYTEARLTAVALALMEDLDKDTVEFRPTYDGSQEEPVVFPARFPNLLANGSSGIAVGMSTAVPPHNVAELLDCCLYLIKHPDADPADLLEMLPGPDFPTGGQLISTPAERRVVYRTGRGSLRLRCRWELEKRPHGGWRIIITEIPYQVQKSRLIERIAQLIITRKCPFLTDVQDESDLELRIVLEPRAKTVDPDLVMAFLFKNSDLETRVSFNLNVIVDGTRPEVMNLTGILKAWLDHRFVVHTRRAQYELARIEERLHLLQAFLIVHLNIDEVIAIIKEHDEPAPVLMARFHLDEIQAEAILNMRLRELRKLEEMKIRKEIDEKSARAEKLRAMLASDRLMWNAIGRELKATRKEFADPRRTEIVEALPEVSLKPEDLVQREPITVIVSKLAWVRTMRGHDIDQSKLRFKGEDSLKIAIPAYTDDTISFVSKGGKVFSVLADRLASGRRFGDPLTVLFDLEASDQFVWTLAVQSDQEYFFATTLGQGFRVKGSDLMATQKKGKQVLTLKGDDALLNLYPVAGEELAAISSGRKMLICPLREFPQLGRGKGVRIQRLTKDEHLVDVITFDPKVGITLDSGRRSRTITDLDHWRSHRALRGSVLPHGFMRGACFVHDLK